MSAPSPQTTPKAPDDAGHVPEPANGATRLTPDEQALLVSGQWPMVTDEDRAFISDLAKLDALAYARMRKDAAQKLRVKESDVERIVKARRAEFDRDDGVGHAPEFEHWEVEPWPEEVDGDSLIHDIIQRIKRHNVMTDAQVLTCALWDLMAWAHPGAAVHSPVLLMTSPEYGSGKTQLLSLMSLLAPRGYHMVDPTPAAVYQTADADQPTLCIDDADTIFKGNNKLRALINASWTKSSAKKKIGGSKGTARWFSLWCPKAVGMIGRLMDASTLSRCIPIEMQRKLPDEHVEDFNGTDDAELRDLRRKSLRWIMDNLEALKNAKPRVPPGFYNRLASNWKLMLAIADLAGGDYPELAREAATAVGGAPGDDDESDSIQLLAAVSVIRDGKGRFIPTANFITELGNHDDQWLEYKGRRHPISASDIAKLLRKHKIRPKNIRVGAQVLKGYELADFDEAIKRYVR